MSEFEDNPIAGILVGIVLSIPMWVLIFWLLDKVD